MENIVIIQEKKFKDILLSLRFSSNNQSDLTARAILAIMLSDRSSKYNTKVLMNEKLDNMFGANLGSTVSNYGKSHVIELSLSALSSKYVDEDLLEQQVEMLSELIYKPLLTEAIFTEAKTVLTDLINRESENLNSYVILDSLRIAGKNYPLENSRFGSLEALNELTLANIKSLYEDVLANDSLQVIVVGDVEKVRVDTLFKKYFKKHNSEIRESSYLVESSEVKQIVNKRNIPSPYISVVYNTKTKNVGREYWALQLMSMVLGQLPNSFLFQEVREKRSLCYSVRSMVIGYDGVLAISSGVRDGSEDEVIELADIQIKRIINNEVSDELFSSAKKMMINSFYQTNDSSRRIVDSEYRKIILKENANTDDLINLVKDIKMEEIIEIAKRLELNTVYKMVKDDSNEKNI